MSKVDQAYIAQRAEALAIVYLTRRPDLRVAAPEQDYGFDLIVHLVKDSPFSNRIFGIQVEGQRTLDGATSNAQGEWTILQKDVRPTPEIAIPACVFLFMMDTDQGFFRWVQEPVVKEQGK